MCMHGRNLDGGGNTCGCLASTKPKLASLNVFRTNHLENNTVMFLLVWRIVFLTSVLLYSALQMNNSMGGGMMTTTIVLSMLKRIYLQIKLPIVYNYAYILFVSYRLWIVSTGRLLPLFVHVHGSQSFR